MNMSLNNCCGQCYDGARQMTGAKKGVAIQIRKSDHVQYTHNVMDALYLTIGDTSKQSRIKQDALDQTSEILKQNSNFLIMFEYGSPIAVVLKNVNIIVVVVKLFCFKGN